MKIFQSVGFTSAGLLLLQATIEFKKCFPSTLGQSSLLIWTCGVVATSLLTLGVFFALRDLMGNVVGPWIAFLCLFYSFLILTYLFGSQFTEYALFSKTYAIALRHPTQEIVPKLVERAQTADSEAKRKLMAQFAYKFCGIHVAYRRDDGSYAEYSPTAADADYWKHFKADEDRNNRLREQIIGGQIKQLPYVITLNAITFLLTFLGAACCFTFKRDSETRRALP